MATPSHVQVQPDSTGAKMDTVDLISTESGTPTVKRQVVCLGDPSTYGQLAGVTSAGNLQVVVNAALPAGTNTIGAVTNTNLDVALSTRLKPADTLAGVTTVAAVTAITDALPAGTNKIGTVDIATAAATSKGTQGANAVPTQDLHDAGRTTITLSLLAQASVVAEALLTLTQGKGVGVSTTTGTSYTVTAGKTLRIQSIQITVRPTTPSTTVTFGTISFRLRAVATGSVTATSPILAAATALMATNVPTGAIDIDIPDGLEIPAGAQIGITELASATTMTYELVLIGYEY